jgi:Tfp pilus assembly protein PilV
LEVVLALAIAAIAMALLAQLVGIANRSAAASRDLTKAQLIAESVMAEFASGVMLPQSTSGTWELDPTWTYEAQVDAGASENLNVITVTVTQAVDDFSPASFRLTQFLFIPPEPEEEMDTSTAGSELGGGA